VAGRLAADAARAHAGRAERRRSSGQADRVPDLTLTLGSKKDSLSTVSQTVVGLSVPLPLFNRNQGNLLSALRRADKARTDAEVEYLKATQALADAHQRATVAQEQIDSMRKDILPAAQSAFKRRHRLRAGQVRLHRRARCPAHAVPEPRPVPGRALRRYRALADLERFVAVEGMHMKFNMDKKSQKSALLIVLVGLVLGAAILFWKKTAPAPAEAPHADEEAWCNDAQQIQTAGIIIAQAERAVMGNVIQLPGEVRFNEDLTAHIVPRTPGVAESVGRPGQSVKKGRCWR
jgi:hypothetical protein